MKHNYVKTYKLPKPFGLILTATRSLLMTLCVAAVVWQLMKAYTLSVLTKLAGQDSGHPIVEKEIVVWVNQKVRIYLLNLYFRALVLIFSVSHSII